MDEVIEVGFLTSKHIGVLIDNLNKKLQSGEGWSLYGKIIWCGDHYIVAVKRKREEE